MASCFEKGLFLTPENEVTQGLLTSKVGIGASLVAQWYRICLPRQETWVRCRIQEESICQEQLKLCATTTEPVLWSPGAATTEACVPRARGPQQEKPLEGGAHAPQLESRPCSPQPEKAHATTKTQYSQKRRRPQRK